jgi:hypothetical protein
VHRRPAPLFLHSVILKYTTLFIFLLIGCPLLAQQAGYRNIILTDSSRRYKPGTQPGDRLYYRPVEIDCWYPAVSAGANPIRYGEFLQLFQQRANRFQDDTVYSNLAGETARYLCGGLGIPDTASLTRFATQTYRDATPIRQRFPLIVYICDPADSIYDILSIIQGPRKYIRFPGATHEDFSCLPFLAANIRKTDAGKLPDYPAFAVKWFGNCLKSESNSLPRDSPYPAVSSSGKATTIAVRVLDAEDKTPLPYVNVGIPGKNLGTVTQEDGTFMLDIDSLLVNDSLAISTAGYKMQRISLKKIPAIILLDRRSGGLPEAVVTQGVRRRKILGNATTSKLVSVGLPTRFLGAEIGVRMTPGKRPRHLERFHCHVSDTRVDSAVFRLNIYRMIDGKPENIMQRSILLSIRSGPGDYSVDLSGLNLSLSGDILVSLELLKIYSVLPSPGGVFFSAAFFNSGTWHRLTSQAEWTKAHGIGVGFNVEVR